MAIVNFLVPESEYQTTYPLPQQLGRWADSGWFTPILGSACPVIGRQHRTSVTLHDAYQRCYQSDELNEEEKEYFGRLGDVTGMAMPPDDATNSGAPEARSTDPKVEDAIFHLRIGLIRAAAAVTALFGERMRSTREPVFDWHDYMVEVGVGTMDFTRLQSGIRNAAVAARRLASYADEVAAAADHGRDQRDVDGDLQVLGPEEMAIRLEKLAEQFDKAPVALPSSQVEFLTDLLWHSFHCRAPVYPTPGELGLQLSLVCGLMSPAEGLQHAFVRPEPGFATMVAREVSVGRLLASILEVSGGDPRDTGAATPTRDDFYRAIACALLGGGEWRGDNAEVRLSATTTFDLELEAALSARLQDGEAFHVVIPVYVVQRGSVLELNWLIGRFERGQDVRVTEWEWAGRDRPVLEGPVVVKLNGSPLHRTPKGELDNTPVASHTALRERMKDLGPRYMSVKSVLHHAVFLSEFDHLRAIEELHHRSRFPDWLKVELEERQRRLFFLGQYVEDWTTRLRLFFQLYLIDRLKVPSGAFEAAGDTNGEDSPGVDVWAVNPVFDFYRSSLLGMLKVRRVRAELHAVTESLRRDASTVKQRWNKPRTVPAEVAR